MIDVLAIGAHPDDLELSCGATIAKLVRGGRSVTMADLTQGELGTRGTKEQRGKEARAASMALGIKERSNLGIADGNIERSQVNLRKVISLIRELQPKTLIIPYSFDRHPDHMHAHELCREAWFYAGLPKIPTQQRGKDQLPHRPDNWFEFMQWHEFVPSFIVDVSDTWSAKMEAIRCYESQFHNPKSNEPETKLSSPQFLELIEARGRAYGEKIGTRYGEPFHTPAPLGVNSPFDLILTKG